jgi:hypothetical protein
MCGDCLYEISREKTDCVMSMPVRGDGCFDRGRRRYLVRGVPEDTKSQRQ